MRLLDVTPIRAKLNGFELELEVSPASHDGTAYENGIYSSDKYKIFGAGISGDKDRLQALINAFRNEGLKIEEKYGKRYYGWTRYLHRGIDGVESGFPHGVDRKFKQSGLYEIRVSGDFGICDATPLNNTVANLESLPNTENFKMLVRVLKAAK